MAETLRIRPDAPMPVAWTARLFRALAESDRDLERTARQELRRIGVTVRVDRAWRREVTR